MAKVTRIYKGEKTDNLFLGHGGWSSGVAENDGVVLGFSATEKVWGGAIVTKEELEASGNYLRMEDGVIVANTEMSMREVLEQKLGEIEVVLDKVAQSIADGTCKKEALEHIDLGITELKDIRELLEQTIVL